MRLQLREWIAYHWHDYLQKLQHAELRDEKTNDWRDTFTMHWSGRVAKSYTHPGMMSLLM